MRLVFRFLSVALLAATLFTAPTRGEEEAKKCVGIPNTPTPCECKESGGVGCFIRNGDQGCGDCVFGQSD